MDARDVGRGLRVLRASRGLALQDIAKQTGLPVGRILGWEQGEGQLEVPVLLAILGCMGATMRELEEAASTGRALPVSIRLERLAVELGRISEELERESHQEGIRHG